MLICPARMDLISLPCRTRPASNFSSRKYSKPALRFVATTFTFSVINGYYHIQNDQMGNSANRQSSIESSPLQNGCACQEAQHTKKDQGLEESDLVGNTGA